MTLPNLPFLIGHRGAACYAPENTLGSLYKAYELGAQWVEFDVMLTRDEQAVIFHDATLNRTTNGRGELAKHDYEDVSHLDAGSWFSTDFCQEKIPTLDQWLSLAAQLGMGINVELKDDSGQPEVLVEKTLRSLERHWSSTLPTPLISSASPNCLHALQRQAPHIPKALISEFWMPQWREILTELACVSWHVDEAILNGDQVREVLTAGYGLLAFTVNDPARARQLTALGITAIFTDDLLMDY